MSNIDLTNFDLTDLPESENDFFEFKSSKVENNTSKNKNKDLKNKIRLGVSGFANSGGGIFVIGVNDNGNADGGISLKFGQQNICDWINQVINEVTPTPKYEIKLIDNPMNRGHIDPDKVVVIIAIYESHIGPHMADDGCYYIRAGAHTVKAKHFIVDAIWAKRYFSKPCLIHLFRLKPDNSAIVQLGIINLTDGPAIDVEIDILPLPQILQHCKHLFPLHLSVVDRANPFFFDISTYMKTEQSLDKDIDNHIEMKYFDLNGKDYDYHKKLEITGAVPPINISNNEILKELKSINNSLSKIVKKDNL